MRNANIMLVETLAGASIIRHPLKHHAVLFQYIPVPLFQSGAVQKTPAFTGNTVNLPHTPEEHLALAWPHRRDIAENPHMSTGAGRRGIGDVQEAEHTTVIDSELDPVEILANLSHPADLETCSLSVKVKNVLF
jgi:hypothetical protein